MIKQVVIQEIRNEAQVSQAGKPYTRTGIKIAGTWYSGLGNKTTEHWQAGMTVLLDLFDETYNGKVYKKFKTPSGADVALDTLKKEVEGLKLRVAALEKGRQDSIPVEPDPLPDEQW